MIAKKKVPKIERRWAIKWTNGAMYVLENNISDAEARKLSKVLGLPLVRVEIREVKKCATK